MNRCYCGSSLTKENCCLPIIAGSRVALSPEAVMRSRYTAFVLADMDYLAGSMSGKAASGFDEEETMRWAESVEWLGLTVLETNVRLGGTQGIVEFVADYIENGVKASIHERSLFKKIKSRWLYVGTRPVRHDPAEIRCG